MLIRRVTTSQVGNARFPNQYLKRSGGLNRWAESNAVGLNSGKGKVLLVGLKLQLHKGRGGTCGDHKSLLVCLFSAVFPSLLCS